MLAKVWKKVLLAICIVACIYNVMSKIVNRHSLEENLRSANDGETVFDFSKKEDEEKKTEAKTTVNNTVTENTTASSETVNETSEAETKENSTSIFTPFNLDFLFQNT